VVEKKPEPPPVYEFKYVPPVKKTPKVPNASKQAPFSANIKTIDSKGLIDVRFSRTAVIVEKQPLPDHKVLELKIYGK